MSCTVVLTKKLKKTKKLLQSGENTPLRLRKRDAENERDLRAEKSQGLIIEVSFRICHADKLCLGKM